MSEVWVYAIRSMVGTCPSSAQDGARLSSLVVCLNFVFLGRNLILFIDFLSSR